MAVRGPHCVLPVYHCRCTPHRTGDHCGYSCARLLWCVDKLLCPTCALLIHIPARQLHSATRPRRNSGCIPKNGCQRFAQVKRPQKVALIHVIVPDIVFFTSQCFLPATQKRCCQCFVWVVVSLLSLSLLVSGLLCPGLCCVLWLIRSAPVVFSFLESMC